MQMKSLKSCGPLFSQCLRLANHNKNLLHPCFQMALINLIVFTCLVVGLFGMAFRPEAVLHFLGVTVFVIVVLFPFRAFLRIRFMAVESCMIYEELRFQKIVSTQFAWKGTKHHTFSFILLMITDAIASFLQKKNKRNNPGLLGSLTGGALLEQAWDMATYYAIPVMIVEKLSFHAAVLRGKDLLSNAGASIGGMIGIDVLQFLFRLVFGLLTLILGGLACFIGFLSIGLHGHFSWIPLAVVVVILLIAHAFIKPFFDLLKMLYFTSLYQATRPNPAAPRTVSATH